MEIDERIGLNEENEKKKQNLTQIKSSSSLHLLVVLPRTSAPVNSKMMARITACIKVRVLAPTEVAKASATSLAPEVGKFSRGEKEEREREWKRMKNSVSVLVSLLSQERAAPRVLSLGQMGGGEARLGRCGASRRAIEREKRRSTEGGRGRVVQMFFRALIFSRSFSIFRSLSLCAPPSFSPPTHQCRSRSQQPRAIPVLKKKSRRRRKESVSSEILGIGHSSHQFAGSAALSLSPSLFSNSDPRPNRDDSPRP